MSRTIVIFQGSSQYHVLDQFNAQFAQGFKSLGYHVEIINLTQDNWGQELNSVLETQNIAFFLSLNAVATTLISDGESIFDRLGIPLVVYLVDHPFYHLERLTQNINNMIIVLVSKDHSDYVRNIMKLQHPLIFLPHGAVRFEENQEIKAIGDREVDILFAGSYSDVNKTHSQLAELPLTVRELTNTVIDRALFENDTSLVQTIEEIFKEKEIDEVYLLHRQYWNVVRLVDVFIRNYRRKKVIESIANTAVNTEVYGNGWSNLNLLAPNIQFKQPLSFPEVYNKMKDSKIVLSVLPNFAYGLHERPLTAMHTGAVNLIDTNSYMSDQFTDKQHILYYGNSYDLSNIKLAEILENTDELQSISDRAYNLVRQRHMWDHRARLLLEHMERHFFFMA